MEGLTRAERRRLGRMLEKDKVVYKFTVEQLRERDQQVRREIGEDMEERFIKVFFSLGIKVGHDRYGWNDEQCLQFAEDICDEYSQFLQGRCSTQAINEYAKLTEKVTGIRFER